MVVFIWNRITAHVAFHQSISGQANDHRGHDDTANAAGDNGTDEIDLGHFLGAGIDAQCLKIEVDVQSEITRELKPE